MLAEDAIQAALADYKIKQQGAKSETKSKQWLLIGGVIFVKYFIYYKIFEYYTTATTD